MLQKERSRWKHLRQEVRRKCRCGCGEIGFIPLSDLQRGWKPFATDECEARFAEKEKNKESQDDKKR